MFDLHRLTTIALFLVSSGCASVPSAGPTFGESDGERVPLILAAVADTAAVWAALSADPFVAEAGDTALVAIAYDSTGALTRADLNHPAAGADDMERVGSLLRAHLASDGPPLARAWFELPRGGAARLVEFRPTSEEVPRILNRPEISRALQDLGSLSRAQRDVTVQVLVGVDGMVKDARVVVSTGSIADDAALLDVARRGRFTPARLGGYPVEVWIGFPMSIRTYR